MLSSIWNVVSSDFKCWACYQREGCRLHALDSLSECTERRPEKRPVAKTRTVVLPPAPEPRAFREDTQEQDTADAQALPHLPGFYDLQPIDQPDALDGQAGEDVDEDYFRMVEETKANLGSSMRRQLKHVKKELSDSGPKRQNTAEASGLLSRSLEDLNHAQRSRAGTEDLNKVERTASTPVISARSVVVLPSGPSPQADDPGPKPVGEADKAGSSQTPKMSTRSARSDDDDKKEEFDSDDDGRRIDRQYEESGVADRLATLRMNLYEDGDTVPKVPAFEVNARRQDQAKKTVQRKTAAEDMKNHVGNYQDLMRHKFVSIGATNINHEKFRKTVSPSVAVVDAVSMYHSHSVELREFYPMPGDYGGSDGDIGEQHKAHLTLSTSELDGAGRFWPRKEEVSQ